MTRSASRLSGVLCALVLVVASGLRVASQSPTVDAKPPTFDVASVKPNKSGEREKAGMRLQRGRFGARNYTLRELIQAAYSRRGFDNPEISGGQSWIDADRFDVAGTGDFALAAFLPSPNGTPGLAYRMLQTLLEERFRLRIHRETRQLPVFALVTEKRDGGPVPGLRRSDVDCDALLAAMAKGERPPARPPGARPSCSTATAPGRLTGTSLKLSELADALTPFVDRPVIDRSGLAGRFDFVLEWTPPGGDDGVSIFTALQEQLGLKLESAKGPVEVLVIDHAEKPTPD